MVTAIYIFIHLLHFDFVDNSLTNYSLNSQLQEPSTEKRNQKKVKQNNTGVQWIQTKSFNNNRGEAKQNNGNTNRDQLSCITPQGYK